MKERGTGAMSTSSMKAPKSPKLSPVSGKTKKRVKFVTSPMWKGVGAATGGSGKRSVLRVLPANARNSKLLVGAGSQRTASFGKSTKTSFPESVPAVDKENAVAVKMEAAPVLLSKAIQTEDVMVMESCPPTAAHTRSVTTSSFPGDLVSLEEYWRELAEQRRQALADTLMENEELHAEIVLLKCKVKELEAAASDAGYFAMMYHVSADSGEGSKEAEPVKT